MNSQYLNTEYQHFYKKSRDAALGGRDSWAVQSTGERVAVALVLNRPDWLASMGYTIPEAIDRAGSEWVAMIRPIERQLYDEGVLPSPALSGEA